MTNKELVMRAITEAFVNRDATAKSTAFFSVLSIFCSCVILKISAVAFSRLTQYLGTIVAERWPKEWSRKF